MSTCQSCDAPLPDSSPGGLCPACLMREAVGELDSIDDTTSTDFASSETAFLESDPLEGATLGDGGRYKILQRIGEGGFGTVYMAEQSVPVRRRVALKILKAGMDTRQVVARFEAERQALAMMDHPNIAKILDGGETEHGRPFFVMDLVRGTPITTFCDREKLAPGARLDLFIQVCRAVQHAHQKGIIHRDLKPGNILVAMQEGGDPEPKVIDFGVAKAMESNLTDKTVFTRFEQMIGTPAYMSPEQAGLDGLDIDTRSDVYSLGVLLYELLTGTTPFDSGRLAKAGIDEVRRIIREEEPATPSTRLTANRKRIDVGHKTVSHLDRVARDLDWIVMKALQKDRRRRYDTAAGLALDLGRFLANEPVSASPPGLAYRTAKFLRRYRVGVAVTGLVMVALAAGAVFGIAGFLKADEERIAALKAKEEAKREAAISTAVNNFLRHDLLAQASPLQSPGIQNISLKEVLDRAAETVDERFPGEEEIRASIHYTLGTTYHGIGDLAAGEKHMKIAGETFESLYGWDHPPTLLCYSKLAGMIRKRDHKEGLALHRKVLEHRLKVLGPDDLSTLGSRASVASVLGDLGQFEEAESELRRVLEKLRRQYGPDHAEPLATQGSLIKVLFSQGVPEKQEEAIALAKHRVQALEDCCGTDAPSRLLALNDLATMYGLGQQLAEAETLHREVLAKCRKLLGKEHPRTVTSMGNLGLTLCRRGNHAEGIPLLQKALELEQSSGIEIHPGSLAVMNNLADAYGDIERPEMAIPLLEKVVEHAPVVFGKDHPNTLSSLTSLARKYAAIGNFEQAIALHQRSIDGCVAKSGAEHPHSLGAKSQLASTLNQAGQIEDAEKLMRDICAVSERSIGAEELETAGHLSSLGHILQEQSRQDKSKAAEAAQIFKRVLDIRMQHLEENHPRIVGTRSDWIASRKSAGETLTKDEEAELWRMFYQGADQRKAEPEAPEPVLDLQPELLYEVQGSEGGDQFGTRLASVGDVNGDGSGDFAVRAFSNGRKSNYVRIVNGKDGGEIRTLRPENPAENSLGATGRVTLGDLDNDGTEEFVLWDRRDDTTGKNSGKAMVFSGKRGEVLRTHLGSSEGALYGQASTDIGDLDGDGHPDYSVMDMFQPNRPALLDLFSARSGNRLLRFFGDGSIAPRSVTGVGDLDGDGISDLAILIWDSRYKPADPLHFYPEIWYVSGKLRGEHQLEALPEHAIIRKVQRKQIEGERFDGMWNVGDLDGDQIPDLAVNVFLRGHALMQSHRTLTIVSSKEGVRRWSMESFGSKTIGGVYPLGDINNDGVIDIALTVRTGSDSRLRILSGRDGTSLHSRPMAGIRNAALMTIGDHNGDGVAELAVRDGSSGPQQAPNWAVRVYSFSPNPR